MPDLASFDWKNPDYDSVWRERALKLAAIRRNPAKLPALQAYYAEHPIDWINDWGITFDPRNAGTSIPTTMPFLLFPRQAEYVTWLFDRLERREDGLVEKSRDMGLSWLCVAAATHIWLYRPGSVIGFGSRKEDFVDKTGSPDALFWKLRTYIDMLPREFKPRGYNPQKHAPYMRISNLQNESAIVGEAGDNIGRGGRTTLYFKDESAHYEHPETVDAALSQNTNVQIDISTPNGEGNPFWQKAHGGKIAKFVFDWREDPRKGEAWYRGQINKRTAVVVAAEIDRNYSASITNSFIDGERVGTAMRRGPADVRPDGLLRVGLDVARFGDDWNVLTFRRGRVVLKQVKWRKCDLESTAGRAKVEILAFKELPEQIAVDVVGLGAGVADILRRWPEFRVDEWGKQANEGESVVKDVNSSLRMGDGQNYNLRAFMWSQVKDWLETASIPNDQDLRASLTACRYTYRGGELLLESKEEMKKRGIKSPDEADSLALTFAYPGTPRRRPSRVTGASYTVDSETGM